MLARANAWCVRSDGRFADHGACCYRSLTGTCCIGIPGWMDLGSATHTTFLACVLAWKLELPEGIGHEILASGLLMNCSLLIGFSLS